MEYIYAAMLIHKAGKNVDEATVRKVLEAAGIKVDESRVKALVAVLEGVNIDEAIEKAAVAPVVIVGQSAPIEGTAKKEEPAKKAEDDKKQQEQAAAGLGALFG